MKLRPHSIDFLPLDFNASRDKRPLHRVYTKTGATKGGTTRFNSSMGAMQTAKLFRSSPKTDKKNRATGLLYRMHDTSNALFSSSLKGDSAL